mgnify:CR=1 FL=1
MSTVTKEQEVKTYTLALPVCMQGTDVASSISEANGNLKEGFLNQAAAYDHAASNCRRMAAIAAEVPELEVLADAHIVEVTGPVDRLAQLVVDEVLIEQDYEDEEEDEVWEVDDPAVDEPTDSVE